MSSNSPLPFFPKAQRNESPISLLRRAALGNGYSNLLALLHSLSPSIDHSNGMIGYVARNPSLYSMLCEKLGIAVNCRKQVSYQRAGNGRDDNVIWQGCEVNISDLQFGTEKICIPCYLEKGFTLADWDHFAALGCPEHHVFLDTCCPVCKTPWRYQQGPLTCGCDTASVLSTLRPIQKSRAKLLPDIVTNKRQDKILMLSKFRKLFDWWSQLDIHISQAEQSDFLYYLMQAKWPGVERSNVAAMHPRIIILPLLSATDRGDKLPEAKTSAFRTINIDSVSISRKDAQLLFGVSRARFENFIKEGVVNRDDVGMFPLQRINELLLTSKWLPFSPEKEKLWKKSRAVTTQYSLAMMVKEESQNALPSTLPSSDLLSSQCSRSTLTIKEATQLLRTNAESIRHLIKTGLIKAAKGTKISAVQWSIKREDLLAFNRKYVFASAIARKTNLSVMTTSSRLRSLGLTPVSGPGIDKGKTYLFYRSDLMSISDESLINKPYQSPAGRKRKNDTLPSDPRVTSLKLAKELHLDPYQIRFVVRDGWIKGSKNSRGHYLFHANDVERLTDIINNDYIDLERASEYIEQPLQSFRRTWIISGYVSEYKLGDRRLIKESDFRKIQRLWTDNKTSSHIAKRIRRQRSFCINLEKIGILKPTLIIGKKAKKIKLYPDNHPIYQCYTKSN